MVRMLENPTMKETDPRLAKFERFEKEARQPSWVFPLRKAVIARFAELGFPTLKDEDWRFTNVAPIAKLPFKPVFGANTDGVAAKTPGKFTFADLNGPRLVFVDGCFAKEVSTISSLGKGVKLGSLATALV